MRTRLLASLLATLSACGTAATTTPDDAGTGPDLAWVSKDPLILARPYEPYLQVPVGYDPAKPTPLLIHLHGYRSTPFLDDGWFKWTTNVDAAGYLLVEPLGSKDANGFTHWNSNAEPNDVDDVAYIDAIIADMEARFSVDKKRVYVVGHSNGSGMAYLYACRRAATVAAVIPLAGTYSTDPMRCAPTASVSVLHVNGDKDPNWPGTPPVRDSPVFWAAHDGCGATSDTTTPPMDLDTALAGAETTVEKWTGCKDGTDVELWVVRGADHHPTFGTAWAPAAWTWLSAHAKP